MNHDVLNLDELMEEARTDLSFDLTNADKVSIKIPFLCEKYARKMVMAKASMKKAEMDLASVTAERTEYYLKDHPMRIERRDMDIFVHGDKEYIKSQAILETKKLQVEYLASIMSALSSSSYNIGNAIRFAIFKAGGN